MIAVALVFVVSFVVTLAAIKTYRTIADRPSRHERCLQRIASLESELGLAPSRRNAHDAARSWQLYVTGAAERWREP